MARCLLALGSNLGDRRAILAQACAEIVKLPGCQLLARSRWHGTVPIGGKAGQGEFLNGAILLETTLEPQQLATALQQVETGLGRQRAERWDARTIDIDLLLYGQTVIDTAALTVPHPRMSFRKFVLEPAAEIAGHMLHPTSGWTIARLLAHLHHSSRYVVVTAVEKPIADWLVSQLSRRCSPKGNCPVVPKIGNKYGNKITKIGASSPGRGIEFTEGTCGIPPVLAAASPEDFSTQESQKNPPRPALVIAIDVAQPQNLRAEAASAGFVADLKENVCVHAAGVWLNFSAVTSLNQVKCGRRKFVPDPFSSASPVKIRERLQKKQSASFPWQDYLGLGPLARITVDDPATVLQEAEAALRCIWPDIG